MRRNHPGNRTSEAVTSQGVDEIAYLDLNHPIRVSTRAYIGVNDGQAKGRL